MMPIYRYMDSHPFQKSSTPFTYQYPSMETVPSHSMMDPTKSCMPPHDSGRNCWHYGYPMSSYSCCNGGNFFPGCYNFRPSHLPVPPYQHMHCYGGYPHCPEPYYVQYVPPTHYNVEQPRYEFDKNMMRNHHCCGCPNSLCGQNRKEDKCVKIEEEKPENQRKGSLVPFQLGNIQSPIVWIPPDYVGSEKEKEPSETGNVKQEKERQGLNLMDNLESVEQAPKFCSGWPLSDLSRLRSLLPDSAGMGAQNVQNKQQEDRIEELPFPVIWMPAFGREETARKADVHDMDAPARPSNEPSNAGKLVPVNILKKDDATSEGPDVVKTVNQIDIPEMDMNHKTEDAKKNKERRCIPVEAVKDDEERELSRNNLKGRSSSSSPKKSRLPPVCLRVDPLPKKKNGNGSSRSQSSPKSTAVKESSQLDSKINNVTGEPDGEKIIKTVEVKTHQTADGNQVHKEDVSSAGEPLSLPTQPQSQEKSFDKLCKEEEESPSKEYREKDETMTKASPEKAVDEGLEVSSGDLTQEEGKCEKPSLSDVEAAMLIQSAYRGYEVRKWDLLKKMKQLAEVRQMVVEVQNRVKALELAPQDEKERMFVGEMIMRLLLQLDTIQGLHPSIRELRKSLAKELVALQEKLDCMVINKPTEVVPEASMERATEHFEMETHDDIKEEEQQKDVVSIGEIFPKEVNESNSLLGESHGAQPLGGIDDMAGSEGMKAPTDEELRLTADGPGELQEVDDQNTTVSHNEDTSELSSQTLSDQIEGEKVMPSLVGDKRADEAESMAEMEQNVKVMNDAEKNVGEVLRMDMNEESLDHHQYSSVGGHPAGDCSEVHVLNPHSDDQVGAQAGQAPAALDEITISTPYENGQTGGGCNAARFSRQTPNRWTSGNSFSSSPLESMAIPKLASLTVFLALIVFSAAADAIVDGGDDITEVVREDGSGSSLLKIELEKLNSKIRELEVLIDEKARELEKKDYLISQKDEIFRDKSDRVSFLESEIESLQREGKLHAEKTIAKAHSRAGELEKQVSELKKELDAQNREKNALEVRSNEAEKKMHEFISKLEKLQNTNEEQKSKIQKLERALKVAEEEMIKAKFEVTSRTEELMEVHGAWLPPWLASFWNEHAKPIVNMVVQKVWVGKTHVENWLGPHVEPIKSKWIPAMHERWLVVKTNYEPHLQSLCKRSSEAYEASKQALTPHIIRAQEFAYPYFQKLKMVSKPYVDHVATLTKPHVDKVRVALNPYTKEIVHACGNFMQSVTTHHQKVKSTIQEVLNRHDITRPVATKEFEWLWDSALLALPMLILFNLCSCCGISRKKARKSVRGANTNHVRRKGKKGTSGK